MMFRGGFQLKLLIMIDPLFKFYRLLYYLYNGLDDFKDVHQEIVSITLQCVV